MTDKPKKPLPGRSRRYKHDGLTFVDPDESEFHWHNHGIALLPYALPIMSGFGKDVHVRLEDGIFSLSLAINRRTFRMRYPIGDFSFTPTGFYSIQVSLCASMEPGTLYWTMGAFRLRDAWDFQLYMHTRETAREEWEWWCADQHVPPDNFSTETISLKHHVYPLLPR